MTTDPLAPVARALHDAARHAAGQVLDAAEAEAERIVNGAQAQVAAMLAQARDEGRADASAVASGRRARGRRQAGSTVLSARRRAYEELGRQARMVVRAELASAELGETLITLARKTLGPDAVIQGSDDAVTATADGRRLRLSLDDLADEAIAELGLGA